MIGITTKEQSERLVIAGIDEATADFADLHHGDVRLYPAWSMAKLWKILHDSGVWFYEYSTNDPVEKVMESLVCAVERASKQGKIKSPSVV